MKKNLILKILVLLKSLKKRKDRKKSDRQKGTHNRSQKGNCF